MPRVQVLVPSAARSTSGASIVSQVEQAQLSLITNVTALTGLLPSLTVTVQWSHDGTVWADDDLATDSFSVFSGTGGKVRRVTVKGPWMRISWTIGGTTPSVTFSVTAY